MGQLFDRSIRKGFSDIFDSAYGASALENRLKGALASSLYDARLSSSGYNKARTRTVEDELANRQELLKRAMAGDDPNAVDRILAGPGHAQDYMKGRVGARKDAQLVGELERLEGLGTPKAMDYRSGAITGSNRGQIGAGRLSEEKMAIARENEDALTAALGKVTEMGIDPKTNEGQSLIVEIMARGKPVSGTDLKNMLTTESAIGLNEARSGAVSLRAEAYQKNFEERNRIDEALKTGRMTNETMVAESKVKKNEAAADMYGEKGSAARSQAALYDAKVFDVGAAKNLKEGKLEQVKADIENDKKKLKADIKRIDQLINSGKITDDKVKEETKLLLERTKTEVKKREKLDAVIDKLGEEGKRIGAEIKKLTAQTDVEQQKLGLAMAEFLGLDVKSASGDALLNNYTKMLAAVYKENPPITLNNEPIYLKGKKPGEDPDFPLGMMKLFQHLTADEQKEYVQSRLIDDRAEAFLTLGTKNKAEIEMMLEGWQKLQAALAAEVKNKAAETGDNTVIAIAPKAVQQGIAEALQNEGNMSVPQQDRISGLPGAAASAQSLMPPPAGDIQGGDLGLGATSSSMLKPMRSVTPAQSAAPTGDPTTDALANLPEVAPVQGGDLATNQAAGFKEQAAALLKSNGFSQTATEFISEAFVAKEIDENDMMQMMKNDVKINRDLLARAKAAPDQMSPAVIQVLEYVIEWQESALKAGVPGALQGQP